MAGVSDVFDAVVVGGGPAGLSAALALGRATRRVLLAADGPGRNARASAAHNVFTRDGTPPGELVRIGLDQLRPYDVTVRRERVSRAAAGPDGFTLTLGDEAVVRARGLVLAFGVRDILPATPGFEELWGRGVFHCPYCHGWEVAHRPLALYGRGEAALHLAQLVRGWSRDLVLFTDGPAELPDDELARIRASGIVVREERVERLIGADGLEAVVLEGNEALPRDALFLIPKQELRSDLPLQLGCGLADDGRVEADALGRTAVPKVFVAGDAGPNPQSVAVAAASGTVAGAALNNDLLVEEFQQAALADSAASPDRAAVSR